MAKILEMPYQLTVRIGDMVEMSNGAVGIVRFVNFPAGGSSKLVFVEPDVVWYKRWWMHFSGQLWFRDQEINQLVLLARVDV